LICWSVKWCWYLWYRTINKSTRKNS